MPDLNLWIAAVSIDCADPGELAAFYATLLGGEITWSTARSTGVRAGTWTLALQKVDDYAPPTWPGSSVLHLDLNGDAAVDDLVAMALAAGARVADQQPGHGWTVLLDPAGHPFCITSHAPPD